MALLPTAINALARATGTAAPSLDPQRAAAELLGAETDTPPTLSEWVREHTDDDPTQLKIVGTSDPDMSAEERIRMLEEAEKNEPDVPKVDPKKADASKSKHKRATRRPAAPPKVLPPDEDAPD